MRAKRNPQYDEMFLGGILKRGKRFAEENPGAVSKAKGLFGGRFGLGIGGPMSGMGLMGMLRDRMQQRRDTPQAEYGAKIKPYRTGGMIYADQGDILQTEKEKNKTSSSAELPGMSKVREIALGDPRGGQGGQTSSAFFGAFPQEEIEEEVQEEGRFSKSMRPIKRETGSNVLPEVEVVGRREQPQEEKKEFKLIEGDPNEMVRVLGKDGKAVEMTRAQLNQRRINKFNEANPDAKVKNILSEEEEFGYEPPEVFQLPLSPDRLLQKYMRGQLDDAYENDPNVKRQVDMAMREFEKRGGKFRDDMTRYGLFTSNIGTRPEIYKPGYGFSEEELAEMIPRYAAMAKEQGKVLPPGFERFLTEE